MVQTNFPFMNTFNTPAPFGWPQSIPTNTLPGWTPFQNIWNTPQWNQFQGQFPVASPFGFNPFSTPWAGFQPNLPFGGVNTPLNAQRPIPGQWNSTTPWNVAPQWNGFGGSFGFNPTTPFGFESGSWNSSGLFGQSPAWNGLPQSFNPISTLPFQGYPFGFTPSLNTWPTPGFFGGFNPMNSFAYPVTGLPGMFPQTGVPTVNPAFNGQVPTASNYPFANTNPGFVPGLPYSGFTPFNWLNPAGPSAFGPFPGAVQPAHVPLTNNGHTCGSYPLSGYPTGQTCRDAA